MRLVIAASTAGTVFEGYDYFIFGALASILSTKFFSGVDESLAFIFALLTFAVGFVTRPLGAIVFGRMGDSSGRKRVFLVTISLMGGATAAIGLLPTYGQAGVFAPALLLACRMLQGFALGGEYGGAVIYVAEHSALRSRGFNTGWIQATGAFGLITALSTILLIRTLMGEERFQDWGWRVPFLISLLLLAASVWIRTRLAESPVFSELKEHGAVSGAPLRESFTRWENLKIIMLALFGLVMATGVMFYAGGFFAQFFLERIAKVKPATVNAMIVTSTIISAPLFILFGALSDKIGRKPVMLGGMALMLALYFPAFKLMEHAANPALVEAQESAPVTLHAPKAECSFQFDPLGNKKYVTGCDIARRALAAEGVNYKIVDAPSGAAAVIEVAGVARIPSRDAANLSKEEAESAAGKLRAELKAALADAGYPDAANPERINFPLVILILIAFVTASAAVSGPQAAALSELFPARIRYTALSFPYHVGLGWFGGFMPAIAFATIAMTGDTLSGLWYPFVITAIALTVSLIALPETKGRPLTGEVPGKA